MEFKSKTSLQEHINELVRDGYLTPEWIITDTEKKKTKAKKHYTINFDGVGKKK